jgi:hypothetical protein
MNEIGHSKSGMEKKKGFKWSFDPHVLWPFDKEIFFELVTGVNTRNFTVLSIALQGIS